MEQAVAGCAEKREKGLYSFQKDMHTIFSFEKKCHEKP